MNHQHFLRIATAACALVSVFGASPARAELNKVHFEVITGNHTDPFTKDYQQPFFNEQLAKASGGRITAKATPYTQLGLGGYEIIEPAKARHQRHQLERARLPGGRQSAGRGPLSFRASPRMST